MPLPPGTIKYFAPVSNTKETNSQIYQASRPIQSVYLTTKAREGFSVEGFANEYVFGSAASCCCLIIVIIAVLIMYMKFGKKKMKFVPKVSPVP